MPLILNILERFEIRVDFWAGAPRDTLPRPPIMYPRGGGGINKGFARVSAIRKKSILKSIKPAA